MVRARGALRARCGWRACCCGGCVLAGVRLGLRWLPVGPGGVFGAAGMGRALACRVCWASVAAGSGSVVKPRASWALGGDGGPLGLGGPAARPVGRGGLAAIWEIRKFFGGPRCCTSRNKISYLEAGTTWLDYSKRNQTYMKILIFRMTSHEGISMSNTIRTSAQGTLPTSKPMTAT